MTNTKSINIAIVPTWDKVRIVLEQTEMFLAGKDQNLISATTMSVTELIENAVKYGTMTPAGDDITFNMSVDDHAVCIEIANGVRSDEDVESVREIIDYINHTNDPQMLYVQRLKELIEDPRPGVSKLGLYRISYEGQFDLSYTFEKGVLTITARRGLD